MELEVKNGTGYLNALTSPDSIETLSSSFDTLKLSGPLPAKTAEKVNTVLRTKNVGLIVTHCESSQSFLADFPEAKSLVLDAREAKDLSVLGKLSNLRRLVLQFTVHKPDLSILSTLQNLQHISLEEVVNVDFVQDLPALESIELLRFHGNINPLRHHNLMSLKLIQCDHCSYEPLSTLLNLRQLSLTRLKGVSSADFSGVSALPHLTAVLLEELRIEMITPFLSSSLRYLHLENMKRVQSIAPLSALSNLNCLALVASKPADSDFSPVLECPILEEIYLVFSPALSKPTVSELADKFRGHTLFYNGKFLKEGLKTPKTPPIFGWYAPRFLPELQHIFRVP